MQLKRRLNVLGMRMNMVMIKRWAMVFGSGLVIGMFVGGDYARGSIIQDCKIMGMFRVGSAPISCTYHLVNVPVAEPEPKEKKK